MLGAKAEVTRLDPRTASARGIATAPPGHPARGRYVVEAGLLAHGSLLLSGLPGTCQLSVTSLDSGSPLTVAGAAPALAFGRTGFPLSFGPNEPEEPRRLQLRSTAISVNTRSGGRSPYRLFNEFHFDQPDSGTVHLSGTPAGTMVLTIEASSASKSCSRSSRRVRPASASGRASAGAAVATDGGV